MFYQQFPNGNYNNFSPFEYPLGVGRTAMADEEAIRSEGVIRRANTKVEISQLRRVVNHAQKTFQQAAITTKNAVVYTYESVLPLSLQQAEAAYFLFKVDEEMKALIAEMAAQKQTIVEKQRRLSTLQTSSELRALQTEIVNLNEHLKLRLGDLEKLTQKLQKQLEWVEELKRRIPWYVTMTHFFNDLPDGFINFLDNRVPDRFAKPFGLLIAE